MKTLLITTVLAVTAQLQAQTTLLQENFNSGLPGTWTVTAGGVTNPWQTVPTYYSFMFDGTPLVRASDWSNTVVNSILTSPATNTNGHPNVTLEYDYSFRYQSTQGAGFVEVYNGSTWVNVASYSGSDIMNAHAIIDITPHSNAALQVRYRLVNNIGNGWEYAFLLDNVHIYGSSTTGINNTTAQGIELTFYPNPVSTGSGNTSLYISTGDFVPMWPCMPAATAGDGAPDETKQETALLAFYDYTGRCAVQQTITRNTGSPFVFDCRELSAGMYMCRVVLQDGKAVYTGKLVITK